MLPRAKREALELRKGRALLPEEAFRRRGPATRVEWRRSGRTGVPGRQLLEVAPEGAALAVAASVREFVEETAAEDLARLQRTLAHPEVRRVGRRNVLLEDEHAAVARDWALSRVRAVGAQRGLKPRRGLRVEELRTFYVRQLIRVRSIRRIVAEDRSPTKPDRMDLELAVDAACYAGRLVTSDAKLRRSLALWWPKLDVVAFDDWMQQVRGDISRSERE